MSPMHPTAILDAQRRIKRARRVERAVSLFLCLATLALMAVMAWGVYQVVADPWAAFTGADTP